MVEDEPRRPKIYKPRDMPNPFLEAMKQQEEYLKHKKQMKEKYSDISKNRYKQDEWSKLKYIVRPGNNS